MTVITHEVDLTVQVHITDCKELLHALTNGNEAMLGYIRLEETLDKMLREAFANAGMPTSGFLVAGIRCVEP